MRIGVAALAAVGVPGEGSAQDSEPETRIGVATEVFAPEDKFARDIRVYTVAVELERDLGEGLWLRGALGPTLTRGTRRTDFSESEANGFGLGTVGSLRYHLVGRRGFAPYIEAGAGTLFTTERFPPDGTWWNLTYRLGFGVDLAVGDAVRLGIGFRHVHFSNGKRHREENPAYNGNGLALGLTW